MLHTTLPLPRLLACLAWLFAHRDALLSSAFLLGSEPAVRRVARLLDAASRQTVLTRPFDAELGWLHDLLTLQNVHDIGSPEAACFAAIDPEDPAIWEICILAEALTEHMAAAFDEAQHGRTRTKGE